MNGDEDLQICPDFGGTPCVARLLGEAHVDLTMRCQLRAGNIIRAVRFYLRRICARERYGKLGQGSRLRLPKCVEGFIKRSFLNTDGYPFVGCDESSSAARD